MGQHQADWNDFISLTTPFIALGPSRYIFLILSFSSISRQLFKTLYPLLKSPTPPPPELIILLCVSSGKWEKPEENLTSPTTCTATHMPFLFLTLINQSFSSLGPLLSFTPEMHLLSPILQSFQQFPPLFYIPHAFFPFSIQEATISPILRKLNPQLPPTNFSKFCLFSLIPTPLLLPPFSLVSVSMRVFFQVFKNKVKIHIT